MIYSVAEVSLAAYAHQQDNQVASLIFTDHKLPHTLFPIDNIHQKEMFTDEQVMSEQINLVRRLFLDVNDFDDLKPCPQPQSLLDSGDMW